MHVGEQILPSEQMQVFLSPPEQRGSGRSPSANSTYSHGKQLAFVPQVGAPTINSTSSRRLGVSLAKDLPKFCS